jgi:hypothetical protein
MFIDYKELKVISTDIKEVFESWFTHLKAFRELVRSHIPRSRDRSGI